MAILMGASMAVIMLSYMLGMYSNPRANIAIYVSSVLVFALMLWLVRSQATVGQVSYMRAMIPHHSIAIMTSERAQITDPRVRKLADELIAAQQREIAEMRYLIADLEEGGEAAPQAVLTGEVAPEVVSLPEALRTVVVAKIDPEPVQDAEVDKVLGPGAGCMFRRTRESPPVLVARAPSDAAAPAEGVMKLHGKLVRLRAEAGPDVPALAAGATFAAEECG